VGIPWKVDPDSLRSRIPEDAERDALVKRLMKQEWENARDVGSLYGVAEMAAHIVTGIYSSVIGGLGAIHPETIAKTIAYDKDFMSEALKEAEDLLMYKP
ncbi:MAG: hypothetical protein GWN55_15915, partial [Phycisphaerae bacterium]|nr:hypothetical protein [Phycisphaerae bacterium]NIR67506.1 hypothetical protein [candidate division Zixibacteria bacterium]NIU16856.1 hypothetical protein [candidate division Zixibacteria bacterium]NIV02782.1 hypothetical protein [Phycisphaerae bacterium]NIX00295.1 hypothetical protein [Phycisphaerae bacterium]